MSHKEFEHSIGNTRLEYERNELLSQTQQRIREQDADQRLERLLQVMDKSQPEAKREAVPLAFDAEGTTVVASNETAYRLSTPR